MSISVHPISVHDNFCTKKSTSVHVHFGTPFGTPKIQFSTLHLRYMFISVHLLYLAVGTFSLTCWLPCNPMGVTGRALLQCHATGIKQAQVSKTRLGSSLRNEKLEACMLMCSENDNCWQYPCWRHHRISHEGLFSVLQNGVIVGDWLY